MKGNMKYKIHKYEICAQLSSSNNTTKNEKDKVMDRQ